MIRLSRGIQVEKVMPPLFQVECPYRVGQVGVQLATKSAQSHVTCYFYRPQRSWGKVIFSQMSVILFTGKADPPPPPLAQCMLGDTVNKRALCILLECNSCLFLFC